MPISNSSEIMEKERFKKEEAETKAIRLRTLAEQNYNSSDLKSALKHAKKSLRICPELDGTAELVTAFKILRAAADDSPDWYKILQIEPFSHINTIKKQYKKLALTLHPDKNSFAASEEAFKLVGEAFRVLSDKIRRKEFDMKLRIAMQAAATELNVAVVSTFWTACSTCRLLHQFDRKYLGHNLMCPNCKKSFKAVEFSDNVVDDGGGVGERMGTGSSSSTGGRVSVRNSEVKQKMTSVGELLKRAESKRNKMSEVGEEVIGFDNVAPTGDASGNGNLGISGGVNEGLRSKRVRKPRDLDKNDGWSSIAIVASKRNKMFEVGEEIRGFDDVAPTGDASGNGNLGISGGVNEGLRSKRVRKPRDLDKNDGGSSIAIVASERLKAKRAKTGDDETMTLSEMQMLAKKKVSEKNLKLKMREKEKEKVLEKEKKKEKVNEMKDTSELTKGGDSESEKKSSSKNGTSSRASKTKSGHLEITTVEASKNGTSSKVSESGHLEIMTVEDSDFYDFDKDRSERSFRKEKVKEGKDTSELTKGGNLESEKKSSSKNGTSSRASKTKSGHLEITTVEASKNGTSSKVSESGHLEIMTVEDSDFYDFDKDRSERSFRKGQVWAIFDDDDGMPRQYALIDDVVSVNPFEVKLSWLDLQNDVDEILISWEKLGFRICCGRFKVSRKISVNLLNIFSHVVDCDRVAKELYRIYPKKGSVWALYNENATDSEGRNLADKDKRCYDIAVFLTSYSEIHGLSMGYLEKVDGFKSVFKRKDIGGHAIKWLEKDDMRLLSHQIPARKLSGEEASVLAKNCWELDPASLPPELLTIGWGK